MVFYGKYFVVKYIDFAANGGKSKWRIGSWTREAGLIGDARGRTFGFGAFSAASSADAVASIRRRDVHVGADRKSAARGRTRLIEFLIPSAS